MAHQRTHRPRGRVQRQRRDTKRQLQARLALLVRRHGVLAWRSSLELRAVSTMCPLTDGMRSAPQAPRQSPSSSRRPSVCMQRPRPCTTLSDCSACALAPSCRTLLSDQRTSRSCLDRGVGLWVCSCHGEASLTSCALTLCAVLVSLDSLGMAQGYVFCAIGPVMLSAIISCLIFREIRGWTNLLGFGVALSLQVVGVVLLAVGSGTE